MCVFPEPVSILRLLAIKLKISVERQIYSHNDVAFQAFL